MCNSNNANPIDLLCLDHTFPFMQFYVARVPRPKLPGEMQLGKLSPWTAREVDAVELPEARPIVASVDAPPTGPDTPTFRSLRKRDHKSR